MENSLEAPCAARARRTSIKRLAAALAAGAAAGLAGCTTAISTPRPMGLGPTAGPSVDQVIEHVNCEIAAAIKAHDNALWKHLEDDNFVAAIQLTLEVSDTASLDPDLDFIHPIAGAGAQTRTLAVAGQYNSSRDSQFLVSYVVDLHLLANNPPAQCAPTVGPYLGGDLHLAQVIDDGLTSIDRTSRYAIYGSEGPDAAAVAAVDRTTSALDFLSRSGMGEVDRLAPGQLGALLGQDLAARAEIAASGGREEPAIRQKLDQNRGAILALNQLFSDQHAAAPQALAEAVQTTAPRAAGTGTGSGTGSSMQQGGDRGEGVYFQSRIDFAVQSGLSGGPNWTLVHFHGPGGGGGSGGGGGAGNAAGQNLLGYDRTSTDTILITFEASCATKTDPSAKDYWNSLSLCSELGMRGAKNRAGSDAQSHNELSGILLRR